MKILHLYRDLWFEGGIPSQTRCLLEGQISLGHTMTSLAFKGHPLTNWQGVMHPNHTPVITEGLNSLYQLREILRTQKPDLVHITGLWIPIHQLWALEVSCAKIPYVVSTHGNLSPHGMDSRFGEKRQLGFMILGKKLWHKFADLSLLHHAAGVHAHSQYEAELLAQAGISNVFISPIGINQAWMPPGFSKDRTLHSPITFLHLGRLDLHHKGIDILQEALVDLNRITPPHSYKVILAGPSVRNSKKKLLQWAKRFPSSTIEIREPVYGEKKKDLFQETDYFLNMYRYAGMAIAPSEAIAQGIPLIASREGNFGDWTLEADMGFVCPLSGKNLSETLMNAKMTAPDDYRRLSRNALQFARNHSWEMVGAQISQGYEHVLRSPLMMTANH